MYRSSTFNANRTLLAIQQDGRIIVAYAIISGKHATTVSSVVAIGLRPARSRALPRDRLLEGV